MNENDFGLPPTRVEELVDDTFPEQDPEFDPAEEDAKAAAQRWLQGLPMGQADWEALEFFAWTKSVHDGNDNSVMDDDLPF